MTDGNGYNLYVGGYRSVNDITVSRRLRLCTSLRLRLRLLRFARPSPAFMHFTPTGLSATDASLMWTHSVRDPLLSTLLRRHRMMFSALLMAPATGCLRGPSFLALFLFAVLVLLLALTSLGLLVCLAPTSFGSFPSSLLRRWAVGHALMTLLLLTHLVLLLLRRHGVK